MHLNRNILIAVLGLTTGMASIVCAQEKAEEGDDVLNAVVKLEVGVSRRHYAQPWSVIQDSVSGSGVVVSSGRILTCAHCVADANFIRIRKNNEDAIYHAKTEFVDHDRDLALLKVADADFMQGVVPMEFGETPREQSEVIAVGFPMGGRLISYTRGIVSRIEDIDYAHGKQTMLAVQVDAAINPGNSGGPVLDMSDGKIVGIAFQGRKEGEALGYIIPTEIIRCFFNDIEDGRIDGVPEQLFAMDWLESAAHRRYLGMAHGQTGVKVAKISPVLGTNSLQTGDILVEVDGYRVANNSSIRVEGNRIRSAMYPFYLRQIGEKIPVIVLRGGSIAEFSVPTG